MPFLSVMIPVYNGEELVGNAIESVIKQPCKDLEVIIMNDGSKDRTLEICNSYAQKDSRIKVYTHENVGLGKNRNIGMPNLHGECVIFLDHDDAIIKDFYTEEMKSFIQECLNHGIEMLIPASVTVDNDMKTAKLGKVVDHGILDGGNDTSWKIASEFATIIYSNRLLRENQLRFHETHPEMESIFRHKAAYCAKRVLFTNDIFMYLRRINPQSITQTWNLLEVDPVRMWTYRDLAEWHKRRDESDKAAYAGSMQKAGEFLAEYIVIALKENHSKDDILKKLREKQLDTLLEEKAFYTEEVKKLLQGFEDDSFAFRASIAARKVKQKIRNFREKNRKHETAYAGLVSDFEKKVHDFPLEKLMKLVEES